ncbi:hypothetical protein Heshes_26640 [Alicyclobacillus hesperidum]|uniref:Uncharacterized protein n=1 Tax=Alicyclobacillus hesperidum TaxID=89784 RepID=A0A1H2YL92_9BACL|nr:hypothetical protein [Alicyclobacillus hesperidum]GLV14978.1 hypothetical protein Heshes_26640 [Alicyclobacillus hesperidum]SDX06002.1 hypothetical protein SAMN04489725_1451 [Alicyclobacillus hesperidum]
MKSKFALTENDRRKRSRASKQLGIIALLMLFNYVMLVSGEYKDLGHGLLGGVISGIWILVNALILAIIVQIIYDRRRE